MPSNNDKKNQGDETTKGLAFDNAPVASNLLNDHAAAHETNSDNLRTKKASSASVSLDHSISQEFTFFRKKKLADQPVLSSSVAYASNARVTAFAAQLESAVAANAKTQRHIAELKGLMSDVARTATANVSKPKRKRWRRSNWLFYGCLLGFGVGWFLLFPSGHNLIKQFVAFLPK